MDSKMFEVLKWFTLAIIPVLTIFAGLAGKALNWQYTNICAVIITGFGAFLGSVLGVSSRTYKMSSAESEEGGNK